MLPDSSFNFFNLTFAAQYAEVAARMAGTLARRAFAQPRNVSDKGVNDLVTDTDRACEELLVNLLHTAFPTWNIHGEEGISQQKHNPDMPTWWIDPIDGTYNFVHGVPRFGISLACLDTNNEGLIGIVYDPMFDECFAAIRGQGATVNGVPLHVSEASQLRDSLAASGFPADLRTSNNNTAEWAAFVPRCQGMARMGSAALDLCYVASGRFDLYWEYGLHTWDIAAGVLIVREAGGIVTDYTGQAHDILVPGGTLASNGRVHQEAVSVLNSVRGNEEH